MKVLLYCTKGSPYLVKYLVKNNNGAWEIRKEKSFKEFAVNGLVVAECEVNKIEKIKCYKSEYADDCTVISQYYTDMTENIENESCLTFDQLYDYLKDDEGYALHLENVKVSAKTKEIITYIVKDYRRIYVAPQNMQFVTYEKWNGKYTNYVLISIRPEHLVNILNGKKTIEVRKKILKEMRHLL